MWRDSSRYNIEYDMVSLAKEKLTIDDVKELLMDFDSMFSPALSSFINIVSFANKLSKNAFFIIGRVEEEIVGYIAYYENCETKMDYIPSICVRDSFRSCGIASKMMDYLISQTPESIESMALEVRKNNYSAIRFYEHNGFSISEDRGEKFLMVKLLSR